MQLLTSGRVYAWGSNHSSQLGVGGRGYSCAIPSRVNTRLDEHIVVQLVTGPQHTLFLTQDGVLYEFTL